jgi:hypothetical protein
LEFRLEGMEDEKRKLLAKGGLVEDWNRLMTRDLPLEDLTWKDGKLYGEAVLELARSCMVKGGLLEYECYDDRKKPQGRALLCLSDWESFPDGLLQGAHLAASDPYYEWYAQQRLKDGKCLYHLCADESSKCKFKLARGDRREVVHIQKWRLVNPLAMMENEYMRKLALELVKRLVEDFVPAARVPEPTGRPPPEAPGGPGVGGRADVTGLDRAAKEAALEEDTRGERKPQERRKKGDGPGVPRGSVGLLLEQKAVERREGEKEKEEERRGRKRRSRSRSRRRKKKRRSSETSQSKSGRSESGESSGDFRMPSTRGEDELWRLSKKHPGRLLKRTMKELQRYLGEMSAEGETQEGWMRYRMLGYINQIVLTQHPPNTIGVRNYRELITLGTGIDLLLQGRLAELGDLMAQRLKALETSFGEQGWQTARHQELIPPQAASLTTEEERRRAARQELAVAKLRQMNMKNKGQGSK